MNRKAAVALLALSPALAQADSVFLKGGGEIKGEVVERRADAIVMEVGPGRITLPLASVTRVVSSTTDLGLYNARAAALAPRDVAGWISLGAWAQAHDLATQAREAYGRANAADPMNAAAHLGLGDVEVGGRWMDAADANRARGLVDFEGTWMTPEERQDRVAERSALEQDRQAAREADARAREAEARVREAEARARAAEAEARQSDQPVSNGIPLIYGGGVLIPGAFNRFPHAPAHHRSPPPPPAAVMVPVPPPASPSHTVRPAPPAHEARGAVAELKAANP
jgi:hypothetical protein